VQDYIMPRVRNNVFLANAAYYRMRDRLEHYSGGRKIVYPLAFEPEGGGGQWWNSNDKIDTRHRAPFTAAEYYAVNGVVPITVLQEEEDMIGGETQVMSLVANKMKLANRTAVALIGGSQGLFSDGSNSKAIAGLEKALPDAPGTLHTYGGIPTSSTQNTWWQSLADTTAYTTGTAAANFVQANNWAPLDKAWASIGLNSDGASPTLALCNWGAFNDISAACTKLDSSFRPQQDTDLRKAGFINITYKNAAIVVDPSVPRTAGKVEKMYFLNEDSFNLIVHEKRDLDFVPWREPVDQFLRVAYILWRGQLCFSERRCNLKMTNITTTATS